MSENIASLFPRPVNAQIINELTSTQVPRIPYLTMDELEVYLLSCTALMTVVEKSDYYRTLAGDHTVATCLMQDPHNVFVITQMVVVSETTQGENDIWTICRCSHDEVSPLVTHLKNNFMLSYRKNDQTPLTWVAQFNSLSY